MVNAHMTPVVLVCVGHDKSSGEVGVWTPEGIEAGELVIFLRGALDMIARGEARDVSKFDR
jgi:hypothetical protein